MQYGADCPFRSAGGLLQPGTLLQELTAIWENDRWFRFPSFEETARFCGRELETAGLEQVELYEARADGRTRYGDWVIPRAWDARKGILQTADGDVLADYEATPCSLLMYSAATPAGGIEAEVLPADNPDALSREEIAGKLLFTGRPAGELVSLAARGEALGILSDFMPLYPGVRNRREEMTGESHWDNSFIQPINDTGLFGFSLSPEKGDRLRKQLEFEPVRLRAEVDTRFYDGPCYTVSALLP